MKVFELHEAFRLRTHGGIEWRANAGSTGTLYRTLESAMAGVASQLTWLKRTRQRAWETERHDIIIVERRVRE